MPGVRKGWPSKPEIESSSGGRSLACSPGALEIGGDLGTSFQVRRGCWAA